MTGLDGVLSRLDRIAVAVSGGVDSMTLAVAAHRRTDLVTAMFHAVSPAVPPEATRRVRRYAAAKGWNLEVLDAAEFRDDAYLNNPVNRCFHCKTHLYSAISARTDATIVSGTNTDDLTDFRPGLAAATRYGVRHPYVEAGLDKQAVRSLARALNLTDVADLPAAPCLSSRVETGIVIQPQLLALVHRLERELTRWLAPQTVRCRIRPGVVVVELDKATLEALAPGRRADVRAWAAEICRSVGHDRPVELRPYRRGSAFLNPPA